MPQVKTLNPEASPTEEIHMITAVLVIGGGWNGIKIASELASAGYPVVLTERGTTMGGEAPPSHLSSVSREELFSLLDSVRGDERIEILTSTEVVSLAGVPGNFHVRLQQDGEVLEREIGAVIVALEARKVPMLEAYGLDGSERVLGQSQFESLLASAQKKEGFLRDGSKDVLFLVGLKQEGSPVVMERAIRSAIDIQDTESSQATILVGNVKLAQDGLERLYKQSREKGVLYFKLREPPRIEQNEQKFSIRFFDGVLHDDVELTPDVVVVEEAIRPHEDTPELADRLRVGRDHEGFLQSDNVHLLPIRSNREGIYVIGSARVPSNLVQGWADAKNALLEVRHLLGEGKRLVPIDKAKIHRGKCTICLTCFRVCPHGAIHWDNRAVISPVACQGCGICAAECPMDAIQLLQYTDDQIKAHILQPQEGKGDGTHIIAFCCQNSGYEAGQTARLLGSSVLEGLQTIKVPCAGKIDVDYILTAFRAGADGVLIFACHKDNCKSLQGNTFAEWRVEDASRLLEEIGLERDRLRFATIASNMPVEFIRIAKEMEERLKQLGPSPVKKQVLLKTA